MIDDDRTKFIEEKYWIFFFTFLEEFFLQVQRDTWTNVWSHFILEMSYENDVVIFRFVLERRSFLSSRWSRSKINEQKQEESKMI